MNVLADESVDRQIVERLRQAGHEILYVAELAPGITDDAVLLSAERKAEIVATVFHKRSSDSSHNFSVIEPGKVRINQKL